MNTRTDNIQENKNGSVANSVSEKQRSGEVAFQFTDNRPETIAQRKLQNMADHYSAETAQRKENPSTNDLHLNLPNSAIEQRMMESPFVSQQHALPIQLKTMIEYGGLRDFTFRWGAGNRYETAPVATSMHAELDPKYPKTGTDTSSSDAFSNLFNQLQARTPTSWVRGHLLNHDLGGIAHYNNLFPITTAANGEHYHEVEKHVKHWVANQCEVTYDVDAQKKDDDGSPDGVFICEAEVVNDPKGKGLAGKKIKKAILSHGLHKAQTKRVSSKGEQDVEKYSGVIHGDGNTVLRDDIKKTQKDSRWDHKTGSSRINNQEIAGAVDIDPINLTDWDSGYIGDDIEAGYYSEDFDADAFDEWLNG
jgi:hypothetical protein